MGSDAKNLDLGSKNMKLEGLKTLARTHLHNKIRFHGSFYKKTRALGNMCSLAKIPRRRSNHYWWALAIRSGANDRD
jgi:hypothetical protein